MKQIRIKAYAKINLSLDVLGKRSDGYHEVEMVMQQVELYDIVTVSCESEHSEGKDASMQNSGIIVSTNLRYLPVNEDNIAYKAARLLWDRFHQDWRGQVRIDLSKKIPVAAGLAGGSADGAAVLHGLNALWGLHLPLSELMKLGGELGADVPFCILGQASLHSKLGFFDRTDRGTAELSSQIQPAACALATGTGTDLQPLPSLRGWIVLSKPPISVSTAAVYGGLNLNEPLEHPNNVELIEGLRTMNYHLVSKNMINLLESVTLRDFPRVMETKQKMEMECKPYQVLMSGSGPTIYGVFFSRSKAKAAETIMKRWNKESYFARLL